MTYADDHYGPSFQSARDTPLASGASGLPKDCLVRIKLFTLDNRMILCVAAKLATKDRQKVRASLEHALAVAAG